MRLMEEGRRQDFHWVSVFVPNGPKNEREAMQLECWKDWIDIGNPVNVEARENFWVSFHDFAASVHWTVYFHTKGRRS